MTPQTDRSVLSPGPANAALTTLTDNTLGWLALQCGVMTYLEAALAVLDKAGTPLHYREITRRALAEPVHRAEGEDSRGHDGRAAVHGREAASRTSSIPRIFAFSIASSSLFVRLCWNSCPSTSQNYPLAVEVDQPHRVQDRPRPDPSGEPPAGTTAPRRAWSPSGTSCSVRTCWFRVSQSRRAIGFSRSH